MGFIDGAAAEAFHKVVEEVRAREDLADLRPAFDPREHADYVARESDGRKAEAYETALRYHGFAWTPRRRLPPMDGRPHKEGMWRHKTIGGFYPSDLTSLFAGGPEQFDKWVREQKLLKSAAVPKPELRKILARR